jgi:two-component system, OmpR family, response regulator MtrA
MTSTPQTILIVEDDLPIAAFVQTVLERDGFRVAVIARGDQALASIADRPPDLILLDWMLPGMDGLQLCRAIRQMACYIPIIMLTARDDESDQVLGLESGADDYITKPFKSRTLTARVRAILRLANHPADYRPQVLSFDCLEIDPLGRTVQRLGQPLNLTSLEFDLLALLAANPNRVFARELLLERIWGYQLPTATRTVDVHIQRLRQQIEDNPRRPQRLVTVRNIGYKFVK